MLLVLIYHTTCWLPWIISISIGKMLKYEATFSENTQKTEDWVAQTPLKSRGELSLNIWYFFSFFFLFLFLIANPTYFRNDPPGQTVSIATQELLRLTETNSDGLAGLDPVKDLHIRDIELVEQFKSIQFIEETFKQFQCKNCPRFIEHVSHDVCQRGEHKLSTVYRTCKSLCLSEGGA